MRGAVITRRRTTCLSSISSTDVTCDNAYVSVEIQFEECDVDVTNSKIKTQESFFTTHYSIDEET